MVSEYWQMRFLKREPRNKKKNDVLETINHVIAWFCRIRQVREVGVDSYEQNYM